MRKKIVFLIGATLAFILFAGIVAVQWRKGRSLSSLQKSSVGALVSAFSFAGKGDTSITEEGEGVFRIRTKAGKTVFEVTGKRTASFLGGVQTLEGVEARLFSETGVLKVTSNEADYDTKTRDLTLRGHVTLRDEKGLDALTEVLVYSDKSGEARSKAPVAFSRGGLRGTARSMRYIFESGEIILEGSVDVDARQLAEGNPDSQLSLRAERLIYGNGGETLEIFGALAVSPPRGAPPEEGTPSWKNACVMMESPPTLTDANQYRIWSPTMTATFCGEALDRLETPGAAVVEVSDPLRPGETSTIRGDRLETQYDAPEKRFGSFTFLGNVSVRHLDMVGYARRLDYDAAGRVLTLTENAEAVSKAYIIRGDKLVYHEEERRLEADGSVQTVARDAENVRIPLPGKEPIHVYSESATVWQAEDRAEFRGAAVARRNEDTVSAGILRFFTKSGSLEAENDVLTRLMSVGPDAKPADGAAPGEGKSASVRVPTLVAAHKLRYDDGAKTAVYEGDVHLSRRDVSVQGDQLHAFFTSGDDGGTDVSRVISRGDVTVESPGRVGRGEWAEYVFAKDEATLGGERDIEVKETETGRVARGRILTYGLKSDSLGIYTDAHGRTVSTSTSQNAPATPTPSPVGSPL